MNNEKKVLKKVLQDKKDNLVLLHLDLYHLKKINPDAKEKIEIYSKEIKKEKQKERVIELEEKMKQPKMVLVEIQKFGIIIRNAKKLIETIEECIKNPSKIYEEED